MYRGMSTTTKKALDGQRGPVDHNIREQIVNAATEHFSHYGFDKTTVSDLAKAIGFSKAYIYRFFDSKQAIGETICAQCLETFEVAFKEAVDAGGTATDKLRRLFKSLLGSALNLFSSDRKLYDIAAASTTQRWAAFRHYEDTIRLTLEEIILQGRETGEFERKTPLDETTRAILQAMQPFINPVMLEYNLDALPDAPNEVVSLILRSLAP